MTSGVNVVVALKSEAQPLIERYKLKRQKQHRQFSVYGSKETIVIVSGIGVECAQNAVTYLAESQSDCFRAWLNMGIVGHGSFDIGTGFAINKIEEQITGKTWFPSIVFNPPCLTGEVITVNSVETAYSNPSGFDMEAAGFYSAACQFSLVELIQCYKIVSDNKNRPTHLLTRDDVSGLVSEKLDEITQIIRCLTQISNRLIVRSEFEKLAVPFLERWQFSVTQQHCLKRLVHQCFVLGYAMNCDSTCFDNCRNSRQVIQVVQDQLNHHWRLK